MIYDYGRFAWVWRALIGATFLVATGFFYFAAAFRNPWFVGMALMLVGPALVFPWMVAVRVERVDNEEIVVTNLLMLRRRLNREVLGPPRIRRVARGSVPRVVAPRAWVPVRGGLPLYLDLYGRILDESAFRSLFRIKRVPRR